jgi:predicted kinase
MAARRRTAARGEAMHQQIARQLRADIEAGVLRDGEALPSTRALAAQWGVSVFTTNQALAVLSQEGLIATRDRSGSVVTAPDHTARAPRPSRPRVVFVGGYAGSGKTELGRILSRATGWPILDKDTLTRPLVEMTLEAHGRSPHDRESRTYLEVIRPAEYEALMAVVNENLQCGTSAIVTAPFLREFTDRAWIDRVTAAAAGIGAEMSVVWVACDADSMRSYIRRRGAARDAAKLANWTDYLAGVDLGLRPAAPHEVIDNSLGAPPLQQQAAEFLAGLVDAGAAADVG